MFLLRRLVGCLICQLYQMVELIQEFFAGGVDLQWGDKDSQGVFSCDWQWSHLGVGLTHSLIERLVLMDGLLQHGDVVTHLLDLTAAGPVRHIADVLEIRRKVKLNFKKVYRRLTFSAFWWKRLERAITVVLSSKPAAKFFQVLSSLAATALSDIKYGLWKYLFPILKTYLTWAPA